VPSKHGAEKEYRMKKSILTTTVAALAIGAAFPLGAFAAKPAKIMTERGVIEKVDPARKEFALKGGYLKRTATFEWNASTRFVENGKLAAASELKPGERADVKYAHHGKQRVATRIAISPGGKKAQAHKAGHA
jgi:hypothetical protein